MDEDIITFVQVRDVFEQQKLLKSSLLHTQREVDELKSHVKSWAIISQQFNEAAAQ